MTIMYFYPMQDFKQLEQLSNYDLIVTVPLKNIGSVK